MNFDISDFLIEESDFSNSSLETEGRYNLKITHKSTGLFCKRAGYGHSDSQRVKDECLNQLEKIIEVYYLNSTKI